MTEECAVCQQSVPVERLHHVETVRRGKVCDTCFEFMKPVPIPVSVSIPPKQYPKQSVSTSATTTTVESKSILPLSVSTISNNRNINETKEPLKSTAATLIEKVKLAQSRLNLQPSHQRKELTLRTAISHSPVIKTEPVDETEIETETGEEEVINNDGTGPVELPEEGDAVDTKSRDVQEKEEEEEEEDIETKSVVGNTQMQKPQQQTKTNRNNNTKTKEKTQTQIQGNRKRKVPAPTRAPEPEPAPTPELALPSEQPIHEKESSAVPQPSMIKAPYFNMQPGTRIEVRYNSLNNISIIVLPYTNPKGPLCDAKSNPSSTNTNTRRPNKRRRQR